MMRQNRNDAGQQRSTHHPHTLHIELASRPSIIYEIDRAILIRLMLLPLRLLFLASTLSPATCRSVTRGGNHALGSHVGHHCSISFIVMSDIEVQYAEKGPLTANEGPALGCICFREAGIGLITKSVRLLECGN